MEHIRKCYDHEFRNNKSVCVALCGKCDPRPCGNCPQIYRANGHIIKQVITDKLNYCVNNCPKYYNCDTIAELNDKLKELEA